MIKRTIEISRQPTYLSAKLGQLIVQPFDTPKENAASIPAEDIGVVVVDHAQVTYSHSALQTLLENGACVVVCGKDHQPSGLLLPISSHTQQVERLRIQIEATKPTNKRLWQQVVIAKIKAQAANLSVSLGEEAEVAAIYWRKLKRMAGDVKSGDSTNTEAQAAKAYWAAWREKGGDIFRGWYRDQNGNDSLNAHLNYGYAILRAAVARSLVAAGLHPALGLHHSNRSNAFCLADDLMEPFRPLVDREAIVLMREGRGQLDQANKGRLLSILTADCVMESASEASENRGPLMVQLHRVTASLVRCLAGEEKALAIPWPTVFDDGQRAEKTGDISTAKKLVKSEQNPFGDGG